MHNKKRTTTMATMRTKISTMYHYAKRHQHFDRHRAAIDDAMNQPEGVVYAQASPESRTLYNLYSNVQKEIEQLFSFLRLEVNRNGMLYLRHTPDHQIEDVLVGRFMERFPLFVIAMESDRGCFIGFQEEVKKYHASMANVLPLVESFQPASTFLKNLEDFDVALWQCFLESQTRKERINPKLFRKNVPKKFHTLKTFEHELRLHKANKTLAAFTR